jgi:hypothetical protein
VISQRPPAPIAMPHPAPIVISRTSSSAMCHTLTVSALSRFCVSTIVRITATGSLMPDSTSSVPPTRCLSWMPLLRSTENTAAASVDETIAPSRNDELHGRPSRLAKKATMHIVPITPTVASSPAGAIERRSVSTGVFRPPSNRISASAADPARNAKPKSSNAMPPNPSDPAAMPSPRKTSPTGTRSRCDAWLSSALAASSRAITTKNTAVACGSFGTWVTRPAT